MAKFNEININFSINVVYNKAAFERTLEILSKTDLLSRVQLESILSSNEFLRLKTYSMLMSKYVEFKIEYIDQFQKLITVSN